MTHYGRQEYWEDRFSREKNPYDWYQRYVGLNSLIANFVEAQYKILNVGAGNSRKSKLEVSTWKCFELQYVLGLSEEMHEDGYANITDIDISHTVTK